MDIDRVALVVIIKMFFSSKAGFIIEKMFVVVLIKVVKIEVDLKCTGIKYVYAKQFEHKIVDSVNGHVFPYFF